MSARGTLPRTVALVFNAERRIRRWVARPRSAGLQGTRAITYHFDHQRGIRHEISLFWPRSSCKDYREECSGHWAAAGSGCAGGRASRAQRAHFAGGSMPRRQWRYHVASRILRDRVRRQYWSRPASCRRSERDSLRQHLEWPLLRRRHAARRRISGGPSGHQGQWPRRGQHPFRRQLGGWQPRRGR